MVGLRERKKQQTRQDIFDASQRLFARHGFDAVTVAQIAEAANVSAMTVFNYFPTKEDLFFGGMQFFEEQLVEAVRDRPRGESALKAFQRRVLQGAENLESRARAEAILRASRMVESSPALQARERQIVDRYTRALAELLAGAPEPDVESVAVAAALMGAHRAVVDRVRQGVEAGVRGDALADDARTQIRKAFGRLERGL